MALTPAGPFVRCASESADHRCARRGLDRREDRATWPGGARPLIKLGIDQVVIGRHRTVDSGSACGARRTTVNCE
jgi:hypothetical protein